MFIRNSFILILFMSICSNSLAMDAALPVSKKQKQEIKSTLKKAGIVALYAVAGTALSYGLYCCLLKEQLPNKIAHANTSSTQPDTTTNPISDQDELKYDITHEKFDCVESLLAKGVRLSENILHFVINGDRRIDIPQAVKIILKAMGKEIDLNALNTQGVSPLFVAIHNIQRHSNDDVFIDKMLAVIDLLIENGAQKNLTGPIDYRYIGETSVKGSLLHAAAKIQWEDLQQKVVEHLQEKKIDASMRDSKNRLWKDLITS